ncbi:HAD-superfamily hydrolase, subfamily IA, variant 1 [Thermoanaerobacter ethanolicus JW 200]|uniref:HAD family hydrolase n=1 Tax=Thermoanaerobacter TaxID=1754 RepID=UPI000202E630|nr:HAD-IA family hydrolase [Thermoanaerobacter sp. RKWS2]EGD51174.1 HAD-superfamily hydrolase, subfamily IA, variant 1 [Thermoanaerobacter ethanolicus JW 200]UZQ82185.1 HAD-IA family hydrolase [Thermoanaerobacter sp. RKWS2]
MDIKAVIFDLDGTLIDSKKDIVIAANKAFSEFNLPTLSEKTLASFIGNGAEAVIKCGLGEKNIHMFDRVFSKFEKIYSESCTNYTSLFPGVKETLNFLKERKINIGIATLKCRTLTEKILKHFELDKYFSVVLCLEDVENIKPHSEIIEKLLKKINNISEETLYVGDSEVDVLCGKNAGVYTCAVTYGTGDLQSIVALQPDFIITNLTKLIFYYLKKLRKQIIN